MKKFLKQYIPYYKNYKLKFFYVFIGIVLVSIGTSGTAYVIKPLLDDIFVNKNETMLKILPFMVIVLYGAKGFGRYIQIYYISYIGQDIIRIIRDKLFAHLLRLDLAFFNSIHGGELISRITNDINRVQNAVSNQIARIIQESLTILALVGVVIYQSPKLAFYGLVVMPLALYPLSRLAKKMKQLSHFSQEKSALLTSQLSETFNNIEIIKANSTEKLESNKFTNLNKDFFHLTIKGVKTNALVSPVMEILGAIAASIVIYVGGREVINNQMSVGTFFSFMTALFMLYTPLKSLSSLYNQFQDAIAANERINDLFALQPSIVSDGKKIDFNITTLEFKNVWLKYDDTIALKNINLKIIKGCPIALVGDSGGGKSSLINLIVRFYDKTQGKILLNNQDINEFDLENLRQHISLITQRVYIFNDTIAANVSYGNSFDEQKVIQALKLANIYDFVISLKDGIYTKLDEFGSNFSGGQRQRIAIARALYKNPQILILDEATSALDNKSESVITDVIDKIAKDRIVIIIAHRLSSIKNVKQIAVFKKGEIVCLDDIKTINKCDEFQKLLQKEDYNEL